MATVACRCCGAEISADMALCWDCDEQRSAAFPTAIVFRYPHKAKNGCQHYAEIIEFSVEMVGA